MQVVLVVAVVVAVICVGFVVVSWVLSELDYRQWRHLWYREELDVRGESRLPTRRTGGRERLGVLLVAVLLLILGAATAAVDDKVANATHGEADKTSASTDANKDAGFDDAGVGGGGDFGSESGEGDHSSGVAAKVTDYFASHMSSFEDQPCCTLEISVGNSA